MDLTKIDYAKPKTIFAKEYERMRELQSIEIQYAIKAHGFINRVFHRLAKISFILGLR